MTKSTPYPIVLAHGVCRFDELMNIVFDMDNRDDDKFHYFRKIRSTLQSRGYQVFHSHVSWAAAVGERARQLRQELLKITRNFTLYPKVHIIAHSMGGLDARHMIDTYRMYNHVASLSTVGTPHWGSSFADWGIKHFDRIVDVAKEIGLGDRLMYLAERLELSDRLAGLAQTIGLNLAAFWDLTTASCRTFNRRAEQRERAGGVRYRTYAGVQTRPKTSIPLRLSHHIVETAEGANDGLASLESAKWTDEVFVEKIEADHLNEIGWWDVTDMSIQRDLAGFEERIQNFYIRIAESL